MSKFYILKKKIIVLVVIVLVGMLFFRFLPNKNDNKLVVSKFIVEKGENVLNVARNLEKKELINNRISFVFYVYRRGLQKEIKAGEYSLNSGLSIQEISEIITKGKIIEEDVSIKITFPEGWNIKNYETRLIKHGFAGDKFSELIEDTDYFQNNYGYEFLEAVPREGTLEGFLFPDTYLFSPNSDAESIIKKMLDNFDEKLSVDFRNEIKRQNKTIYDIVTMASILEEEVRTQEDRKIVSGIFWNRLESGQAFQSCATLAYILGENKKQYSYEDTRVESLYNTYLYPGLPPGPISSPGLDAITAAIYPTDNDYNYFLNNPETGKTVFSRTLEEHNANKIKNGL